jgi:hypothetical protein
VVGRLRCELVHSVVKHWSTPLWALSPKSDQKLFQAWNRGIAISLALDEEHLP